MGRQKKTAPEKALMQAVALFWREGFHNVGTRQIEIETGITRFTLQTSFGGKKGLYLAALDHYLDMFEVFFIADLLSGDLETIAHWVEHRPVPDAMKELICHGCLMVNSITEFPKGDTDIQSRTERFYEMLNNGFSEGLRKAIASGQTKPGLDLNDAVTLLTGCAIGMNISLKAGTKDPLGAATARMVRQWAAA